MAYSDNAQRWVSARSVLTGSAMSSTLQQIGRGCNVAHPAVQREQRLVLGAHGMRRMRCMMDNGAGWFILPRAISTVPVRSAGYNVIDFLSRVAVVGIERVRPQQ